eukprot:5356074-Pleurochrysis_carterae.AAC.1
MRTRSLGSTASHAALAQLTPLHRCRHCAAALSSPCRSPLLELLDPALSLASSSRRTAHTPRGLKSSRLQWPRTTNME